MTVLAAVLASLIVISIATGCLAHRNGRSLGGGPTAWGEAAARRLGRLGGALAIVVVGWVVVIAVGLALGFLARALQDGVDRPVFDWVQGRVRNNPFTRLNEKLTLVGNTPTAELVCLFSVLILAFAYRRRWWLPTAGIVVAFVSERYLQKILAKIVDRGHPPTTLGTYPSGGVGRIIAIYGLVVLLVILLQPTLSKSWRAGLWTGVITAAVVEAFTRVYLSKHWLTDAMFALPFGVLLLLTNVAAVSAIAYRPTMTGRAARSEAEVTAGTGHAGRP